ncbi:hypothetical protein [Polyangium aurulentum]|uniref:hypothetical protein n=1 Tax=Polyangium aurulentum TaxID=2567896 RepID=UPI0010ADB564|nr:hypothetical protein [Polyangium aurulentum]UQA60152.1 hypothetical protein E8A73_006620 [Polyangium aurulentum]
MRRRQRLPLGRKALVWLFLRTKEILCAADPKSTAEALWKSTGDPRSTRKHRYRREVKATLERMTLGGLCMYCEHNTVHQIEHFWPKSRFPERTFCWWNLLFVCGECNQLKNAKFELDARYEPLLVDPTVDDPAEHLELSPKEGRFLALTEKGENTRAILNRNILIRRRQDAWSGLQGLVVSYARAQASGDARLAEVLEGELCKRPFPALLGFLLRFAELTEPERYIHVDGCLDALRAHRDEIRGWIDACGADAPST